MQSVWTLVLNSILLGFGLSMDAFSVSLANGLHEPQMKHTRAAGISGVFAAFQGAMPMIGWVCIHTIAKHFIAFEKLIPWIALILLAFMAGTNDEINMVSAENNITANTI